MKYCTNCGNELADDAKFCVNCGTKVTGEEQPVEPADEPKRSVEQETPATPEPTQTTNQQPKQENETVKAAQQLANGYFSYFLLTLKRPSEALKLEPSNYGFIQMIVLAFISVFSLSSILSGLTGMVSDFTRSISDPFGFGGPAPSTPTYSLDFSGFIGLFIGFLVFYGVLFFLTYIILNACSEDLLNMKQTFARYGGFLSLNIVLLALAALFGFLGGGVSLFFAFVFFALGLGLMSFAFNYSLYKITTKPRINILYILLIGNLVLSIVLFIVAFIFMMSLLSQFADLLHVF